MKFLKRFDIQYTRTKKFSGMKKYFYFEWQPGQICGVVVASITVFGISLVYFGDGL